MTPITRFTRTVLQVLLAIAAAVPAAVALFDELEAATTTKIVGIAGATVIIISAVQNALESSTGRTLTPGADVGEDRGQTNWGGGLSLLFGLIVLLIILRVLKLI